MDNYKRLFPQFGEPRERIIRLPHRRSGTRIRDDRPTYESRNVRRTRSDFWDCSM